MQFRFAATPRSALPYGLSLGVGSLLAAIAPPWFLLAAFLGGLVCIIALTVASVTVTTPLTWSGVLRFALVLLAVPFGGAALQSMCAPAQKWLSIALLFMFGLVLVLALQSGAA